MSNTLTIVWHPLFARKALGHDKITHFNIRIIWILMFKFFQDSLNE